MAARFELFDHTADIGVRAFAPTLAELVAPATDGLYAVIGEVATTASGEPREYRLDGNDPATLLHDYLAGLLHLFDWERRRLVDVRAAEFTARRLVVSGEARPIDPARSVLTREAKAITYHQLAIRPMPGGYEATYIVDI